MRVRACLLSCAAVACFAIAFQANSHSPPTPTQEDRLVDASTVAGAVDTCDQIVFEIREVRRELEHGFIQLERSCNELAQMTLQVNCTACTCASCSIIWQRDLDDLQDNSCHAPPDNGIANQPQRHLPVCFADPPAAPSSALTEQAQNTIRPLLWPRQIVCIESIDQARARSWIRNC